ncbi:MAG: hypothetical protein L0154_15215 [Chloroflexi bacterium]|nr:hypothetical protein [Chloroflexota bacterium]
MKRFIVALMIMLWAVTTAQGPASAYYAGFDELTPGTPAASIALEGIHFSGADWLVRDMRLTGLSPVTLSKNALRGCNSTLTITFDQPQEIIGFNFKFNTLFTTTYAMTVTTYNRGAVVESASYRASLLEKWRYPEAFALMKTGELFDTVTISHNAVGFCLYIDNLTTAPDRESERLGQVWVSAPGTLLYSEAGGGILRDSGGQEMRVPNQSAPDPQYDTYNVVGQTVIDGQVWLQIFVGDMNEFPWIPLNLNMWFLMYGA